jgi:GNAT superfamily N-acetyltransferase
MKTHNKGVVIISYLIRTVEERDAFDLSDLFLDFINKDSNIEAMQKKIEIVSKNPHYHVAVACNGNKVVGTAMGILCYDLVGECNPFMLVENVVVAPKHQGQGIGKLLMNAIEEFGIANGCSYIILVSESKRGNSHKFYEALGFTTGQRGFKKRLVRPGSKQS